MRPVLDLGDWKMFARGEPVDGLVRIIAMPADRFATFEDAAPLTARDFKAEQFVMPARLWDCLVDVIASHDDARAKLKEMYAASPDLAMSIAIPALERFAYRARVRR